MYNILKKIITLRINNKNKNLYKLIEKMPSGWLSVYQIFDKLGKFCKPAVGHRKKQAVIIVN